MRKARDDERLREKEKAMKEERTFFSHRFTRRRARGDKKLWK
jgi:hypothetical protein